MATEISLNIPSRDISWKGKIYESQLVSLLKPFSFLQEKIAQFQEAARQLNPSLSEEEIAEVANQDFFTGVFGGSDQQLSSSVVQLFREIYPSEIVDTFYKLEEVLEVSDGVLTRKGFEIRWRLDASEFAELFQQLTVAAQAIGGAQDQTPKPVKPKAKSKKSSGFAKVEEDPSLNERIKQENERTRKLQALRAQLEELQALDSGDDEEAELVDLEVV